MTWGVTGVLLECCRSFVWQDAAQALTEAFAEVHKAQQAETGAAADKKSPN